MSRRAAREILLKLVYQLCMLGEDDDFAVKAVLDNCLEKTKLTEDDTNFIRAAYEGIAARFGELRDKISGWSQGFKTDRIYKIDMSILIIALFEIEYMDGIPSTVSINEALELAKTYSTDKSSTFINGILASALKESKNKTD